MSRLTQTTNNPTFRSPVLAPNEYRKNYRDIATDLAEIVLSNEASKHCEAISHIYLRLCHAPTKYHVPTDQPDCLMLLFKAETKEPQNPTAKSGKMWHAPGLRVLSKYLYHPPATCIRALKWLAAKDIISYDTVENGTGVRILVRGVRLG